MERQSGSTQPDWGAAKFVQQFSDWGSVDAWVGVNIPDDILKGHARVEDQTAGGTLRVSHEMIATLHGPGFAVRRPLQSNKQSPRDFRQFGAGRSKPNRRGLK